MHVYIVYIYTFFLYIFVKGYEIKNPLFELYTCRYTTRTSVGRWNKKINLLSKFMGVNQTSRIKRILYTALDTSVLCHIAVISLTYIYNYEFFVFSIRIGIINTTRFHFLLVCQCSGDSNNFPIANRTRFERLPETSWTLGKIVFCIHSTFFAGGFFLDSLRFWICLLYNKCIICIFPGIYFDTFYTYDLKKMRYQFRAEWWKFRLYPAFFFVQTEKLIIFLRPKSWIFNRGKSKNPLQYYKNRRYRLFSWAFRFSCKLNNLKKERFRYLFVFNS